MKLFTCIYFVTTLILILAKSQANSIQSLTRGRGGRIVGGELAFAGQFGYSAAFTVRTRDSQFFCGGALFHTQYILTSGHCVAGAELFTITLGSLTLEGEDPNRVTVATSDYFLHEEFNAETIEHDIGLIKLRLAVTLGNYVELIVLPKDPIYEWSSFLSIGHGQLSDEDPELSNHLRYAIVTGMSNIECKAIYGNQITDTMLCAAGNYNQGTCLGDIGGPLVMATGKLDTIAGIASFISTDGCESINPSGYTRTYPYIDWISNRTST